MFGALGAVLSRYSRGTHALDIELDRIASMDRGKFGFNKNILDVTLSDGTKHRLSVERYDEFTGQLREQMSRRGRARVTQPGGWQQTPPPASRRRAFKNDAGCPGSLVACGVCLLVTP